uniref:Uncharacterized protein n=1 Tax=Arundo donax TaxID=35708 RepID=A0A0A9B5J2_ARUDO
MFIVFFIELSA